MEPRITAETSILKAELGAGNKLNICHVIRACKDYLVVSATFKNPVSLVICIVVAVSAEIDSIVFWCNSQTY